MNRNLVARPIGGAAVFLAFALALAACGGGTKTVSSATTTTPTTTAAGSRTARLAAYESCLKSHLPAGVTLPAGGGFGGGFGGGGRRGTGTSTTTGTGSTVSSVPRTFPTTTLPAGVTAAQWQAAQKDCASDLPTGGAGGGFANNAQFATYYNCLNLYLAANNETTLPPLTSGGAAALFGGRGAPGATGATSTTISPSLAAAEAHCAGARPTFPGTSSTTATTS
jgi:hypothetical protein